MTSLIKLLFVFIVMLGCNISKVNHNLISVACNGCLRDKCFRFNCDIGKDSTYLRVIHIAYKELYKISNGDILDELKLINNLIDTSFKTRTYFGAIADSPEYNILIRSTNENYGLNIVGMVDVFPKNIQTFCDYYQKILIPKIISKGEKIEHLAYDFKTEIP